MNDYHSVNSIILVGRIGKDPELKKTKGKKPQSFIRFSMATYRKFSTRKRSTAWHQCSYWGDKRAEWFMQYVKKGMLISIRGYGESRSYTDSTGNKRSIYEIKAEEVTFIGPPKDVVSSDVMDGKVTTEDPGPQSEEIQKALSPAPAPSQDPSPATMATPEEDIEF